MKINNRTPALLLLSSCLTVSNAFAVGVTVTEDTIYQKADSFTGSVHLKDSFTIESKGTYLATFIDFKSAKAFESSRMEITNSPGSLGTLSGPGSFTFSAGPGDYDLSMFAEVGHSQVSAEEKQRLIDDEQKRRGQEWARSQTKEQKQAKKAIRARRSAEEWLKHREKVRRRAEQSVELQLAAMNTGKYGIEISALGTDVSAVPLPAAAWLFGSGMLALAGLSRRKARR